MKQRCAIFSAVLTGKGNQLALKEEWSQNSSKPLDEGYTSVFVFYEKSASFVVGYNRESGGGSAFQIEAKSSQVLPQSTTLNFESQWDTLEPFVLGNQPHVLSYREKTGQFAFFPIGPSLSLGKPYYFSRAHEPGITSGFTMVHPLVYQGAVYYIGYNGKTGAVALYNLAVTATSTDGLPPLVSINVWSHMWAKGWTRFSFFQLGGENFFLKTNIWRPNVNIDHIFDDFSKGTHEVCSYMNLKDAQLLDIVSPFSLAGGDPHFLAYKKSGETTLYRIHSNCVGWTEVASVDAMPGATHIVPVQANDTQLFLFYSST